jgi:hypothetical protein
VSRLLKLKDWPPNGGDFIAQKIKGSLVEGRKVSKLEKPILVKERKVDANQKHHFDFANIYGSFLL